MNQAKKLALERYPKKLEVVREPDYFAPKAYPGTEYIHEVDVNFKRRNAFVEGYETGQKNLLEKAKAWVLKNGNLGWSWREKIDEFVDDMTEN